MTFWSWGTKHGEDSLRAGQDEIDFLPKTRVGKVRSLNSELKTQKLYSIDIITLERYPNNSLFPQQMLYSVWQHAKGHAKATLHFTGSFYHKYGVIREQDRRTSSVGICVEGKLHFGETFTMKTEFDATSITRYTIHGPKRKPDALCCLPRWL